VSATDRSGVGANEAIVDGHPLVEGASRNEARLIQPTLQAGVYGVRPSREVLAPYIVLVQASSFDSRQVVGMTSAGEQVSWQRVSPPPVPPVALG